MKFIESPLEVYLFKNSDLSCSIHFQNKGVSLLVHPGFFRGLGGAQLDYVYLEGNYIYLIEAKSSYLISNIQKLRLKRSAAVLSEIFNKCVIMKLFIERNKSVINL